MTETNTAVACPSTPQTARASIHTPCFLTTPFLPYFFFFCRGRVAEIAASLLTTGTFQPPSLQIQLGYRPYRVILADFENFDTICNSLAISTDSKVTLADVEHRRSGDRIALCLWDICDALRQRGFSSVPIFAPSKEHVHLRHSISQQTTTHHNIRAQVDKYQANNANANRSIPFAPPPPVPSFSMKPRPIIPPLPLDSSPAIQRQRAKAAAAKLPSDKKKSASSKKTTPVTSPVGIVAAGELPPSLNHWLPKEGEEEQQKVSRPLSATILSPTSAKCL